MPATEDLAVSAMFYRKFMQGLGNRAPSISREAYMTNSFIVAFDLEAAPNVQHSGISTLNAPLNIFLENLFGTDADTRPTALFCHTSSDVLMEVSRRGVLISV